MPTVMNAAEPVEGDGAGPGECSSSVADGVVGSRPPSLTGVSLNCIKNTTFA